MHKIIDMSSMLPACVDDMQRPRWTHQFSTGASGSNDDRVCCLCYLKTHRLMASLTCAVARDCHCHFSNNACHAHLQMLHSHLRLVSSIHRDNPYTIRHAWGCETRADLQDSGLHISSSIVMT